MTAITLKVYSQNIRIKKIKMFLLIIFLTLKNKKTHLTIVKNTFYLQKTKNKQ